MNKPKATLRNWSLLGSGALIGVVYDHPHQPDGQVSVTSPVIDLDRLNNLAETDNTIYKLIDEYRDPEPKYA